MRYVIYGTGAIGGSIGGRLFQHGHDVVLIARGAHHDALRDHGMTLRTPDGTSTLPIPVVEHPSQLELGAEDVVIVATKVQDSVAALDALAASAAPTVSVVCAQNGVEGERLALRRFDHVHGMQVALPASHMVPGVIDLHGAPASGILDVGRYPNGVDAVDEQIASDLRASTFISEANPAVMDRKYAKLLMNVANVLEAALGGAALRDTDLVTRAVDEANACFTAAGITPRTDDDAERRKGMQMAPIDGVRRDGGSTWQSLARGASSNEADYLNGEIALLGRIHGVPTPVNSALQRVARRLSGEGWEPGTFPLDQILAEVERS